MMKHFESSLMQACIIALALLTASSETFQSLSSAGQEHDTQTEKTHEGKQNLRGSIELRAASSAVLAMSDGMDNHSGDSRRQLGNIDPSKPLYSTFQCIGGSQAAETARHQHSHDKYPVNDVGTRTCLFRNVCLVKGELTYYISEDTRANVPKDFLPEGFDGFMFWVGHLRKFTMPVQTVTGSIPTSYEMSPIELTFLDSNSHSYNYGHYVLDNVETQFSAARVFNKKFDGAQQLLENRCERFGHEPKEKAFTNVVYDPNGGTYQQMCLKNVEGLRHHFYDHAPLYVTELKNKNLCFSNLMVGAGKTFGLDSMDLSKAIIQREFRDYVVKRLPPGPPQSDLILVAERTFGAAGGSLVENLCGKVRAAVKPYLFSNKYHVECVEPTSLSFPEEISKAREAKIIISAHGTIAYISMFVRDGTQQIAIADPWNFKENHVQSWGTHYNTLFLGWDRLDKDLGGTIAHTVKMSEAFHNNVFS